MRILTTGAASGLGRYLHDCFDGPALVRGDRPEAFADGPKLDGVVHCAFNTRRGPNSDNLYDYYDDNLRLTDRLVQLPARKFIYISTVDVYPKDGAVHDETEAIDLFSHGYFYGITKLFAESVVRRRCDNHLILRTGLPLGPHARLTNPIKVLTQDGSSLSLDRTSTYNCILSSDLAAFIRMAIEKDLTGIFNLVSSDIITLEEMARRSGRHVTFGPHHYECGKISNEKINSICDLFSKPSTAVVDAFLKQCAAECGNCLNTGKKIGRIS